MVPSRRFLSFCNMHFDPCLPLHPLQLILAEASTVFGKTAAFQTLFSTVSLFWSSKIVSKSTAKFFFANEVALLCKAAEWQLPLHATLTCDSLCWTAWEKSWQPHDKCLHSTVCKATSVTSHSYKATSRTLHNAASVFLISLWIPCCTYVLTCYDPISSHAPMVPFFFYYLVSLRFLLIPSKLSDDTLLLLLR